jgi:hypothetical protein
MRWGGLHNPTATQPTRRSPSSAASNTREPSAKQSATLAQYASASPGCSGGRNPTDAPLSTQSRSSATKPLNRFEASFTVSSKICIAGRRPIP